MTRRDVIDTGVFFHPRVLDDLATAGRQVIVPTIAFSERCRHVAPRGMMPAHLEDFIMALGFVIEPFGPVEAGRYVAGLSGLTKREWDRLARDAMIAGHVRPGDTLWTTNPADFESVGVPADQIRPVPPSL